MHVTPPSPADPDMALPVAPESSVTPGAVRTDLISDPATASRSATSPATGPAAGATASDNALTGALTGPAAATASGYPCVGSDAGVGTRNGAFRAERRRHSEAQIAPGAPLAATGQIAQVAEIQALGERLAEQLQAVLTGKEEVISQALAVLLAGGHLLLEDVPGVGKTTLAKALARAVGCTMRRIQFTPDLLPSDITGISVYDTRTQGFEFRPGAVFAHIVVCDEINRASPKTQSAVLECMQESQVTVDGQTYRLGPPFFVIATQNPLEMEGTYPLPEAQRDRFMARLRVGYPDAQAELAMLADRSHGDPLEGVAAVTDAHGLAAAIAGVQQVHASPALQRYVVDLVAATRAHPALRLGGSPRASLHLLQASRARAALSGRAHVFPEDVRSLVPSVLAHRVLPSGQSRLDRLSATEVLRQILDAVPLPVREVSARPDGRR